MNRNYPRYTRPTGESEQEAIAHATSLEVWAAVQIVAGINSRDAHDVWQNPRPVEVDHIEMCLADWCAHGDIDPGVYAWGCERVMVGLG